MDKQQVLDDLTEIREAWDAVLTELGPRIDEPGATGEWCVREVIAHFHGWNRWQTVQLQSCFSGHSPTDEELTGGITYPDNDDLHEDAMNAMFQAGTEDIPAERIVALWREVCEMREAWVKERSEDELNEPLGLDWPGEPRIIRRVSEVPGASNPKPAWQTLREQTEHEREHLEIVRAWMGA